MSELIAEQILPGGTILRLIHGDLTDEHVDAIVNAANAELNHGGGVAAAITSRGGQQIRDESRVWVETHGPVAHGAPAITSGGKLYCTYVIHAVGPIWGSGDEDAKLSQAICGALRAADDLNLHSLAMPAISTGIYGFPKERGARIILDSLKDYIAGQPDTSLQEIRITLIDSTSVEVFAREFSRRWPESLHFQ